MRVYDTIKQNSNHTLDSLAEVLSKLHHDTLIEIYRALVYGGAYRTKRISRYPRKDSESSDKVYIIRSDTKTIVLRGPSKDKFMKHIEQELLDSPEFVLLSSL